MTQVSIPQAFKQYDQGRRKVVKSEEARSCEAPKGQSLRPEGPWLGGFFGWGQLAPPHQLYGMGERCKLLQGVQAAEIDCWVFLIQQKPSSTTIWGSNSI